MLTLALLGFCEKAWISISRDAWGVALGANVSRADLFKRSRNPRTLVVSIRAIMARIEADEADVSAPEVPFVHPDSPQTSVAKDIYRR